MISIPTILTGLYPKQSQQPLPNLAGHPRNLFTLLDSSYRLEIFENITQLSPLDPIFLSLSERVWLLSEDLWLVYLHRLLPEELSRLLPRVTESWKDFAKKEREVRLQSEMHGWNDLKADWSERATKFRDFLSTLSPSHYPTLHFLHSMLPHASWKYLPDGRVHTLQEPPGVRGVIGPNKRGEDVNKWLDDEWLVTQAYQRHLLQVGFVDRLVGELVARMHSTGMWESSLLVITADHGSSFLPNQSRRRMSVVNYPEIMGIPLFIKAPGQEQGERIDRNVETVDILPTILDILEVETSWEMDGQSVLDSQEPERPQKLAFLEKGQKIVLDPHVTRRGDHLQRKIDLFGSGDLKKLFQIGSHPQLLGEFVRALSVLEGPESLSFEISGREFFSNVALDSGFLLTNITGRISGVENGGCSQRIAIAVNGQVREISQTSPSGCDLPPRTSPPSMLDPGPFEVHSTG